METNLDYNKNLDFVINTTVNTSDITLQDKILNSKDYNKTFSAIEESLNLLYEKTRTLQTLMEYSETYIKNEIDTTISECKSLLDSIENNRDLLKDSAYIKYGIKLQSIFDTYSDRNNTPIKGVELHNGVITLNNNTIENVEINNVGIESNNKNFNLFNTKEDIKNSQNYRTFYMFDRAQSRPVQEKIVLHLSGVKTINKINMIPSNCKVTSIDYTLENNKIETVKGYDVNLSKNRNVKSIAINIECDNYMISQIDYNEVKDQDFWNIMNQIENDTNTNIDKTRNYYFLFGLDNISVQFVDKANKSCFVSKDIKIDELKENEYISLEADYVCEEGNIEFYVIDGTNEIAILPEKDLDVKHEKIFYKTAIRFTTENSNDIKIYENGVPVKVSLLEAMNNEDEKFTASYVPKSAHSIDTLMNDTIKVKAIIRNYDSNYIPNIKSISIKKYGGGSLWTDTI